MWQELIYVNYDIMHDKPLMALEFRSHCHITVTFGVPFTNMVNFNPRMDR